MEAQNVKRLSVDEIAAYLFAAILRLAQVCDGARNDDGHGFSKYDTERGHRFAEEDSSTWDADKCHYVRQFLWKYRVQLSTNHGIDLEDIPDARKTTVVLRTIKYGSGHDGHFLIGWDYHDEQFDEIKRAVKELDQRRYNGGVKLWVIPAYLKNDVVELAKRFGFEISDNARRAMEGDAKVVPIHHIRMGSGPGNLVFEFPYSPEALIRLKATWKHRKWDRDDRVWRVNIESATDVASVLRFAKNFNLTCSDEVSKMIDAILSGPSKGLEDNQEPTQKPESVTGSRGAKVEEGESQEVAKASQMGRGWSAGKAKKLFE